jgi:hypothetical protein
VPTRDRGWRPWNGHPKSYCSATPECVIRHLYTDTITQLNEAVYVDLPSGGPRHFPMDALGLLFSTLSGGVLPGMK